MEKAGFDALLAKREQREADRTRIGQLQIPGTNQYLEMVTPGDKTVLDIYGMLMSSGKAADAIQASRRAIYDCCPALQDTKLHRELGCEADPIAAVDQLFSVAEVDAMGGDVLRFLHLLPQHGSEQTETAEDTVKN